VIILEKTTTNIYRTVILTTLLLSGCGSYRTLSQDDSEIRYSLNSYRTNCSSLPRVYGGVSYDICKVNSATVEPSKQLKEPLYFADIGLSAICDTAALPYSIYRQHKDGNLELK